MPSGSGVNVFITVSTSYDPVIHKDTLLRKCCEIYEDNPYCFVREIGKSGVHPHYHIVGYAKKEYRNDTLRKSLYTLLRKDRKDDWSDDEKRMAIVVKQHHDPVGCAGSYMSKEDTHEVEYLQVWTREELLEAQERVQQYKDHQKDVCLPYPVKALREAYSKVKEICDDDHNYLLRYTRLPCSERFAYCYKLALKMGYVRLIQLKPHEKKEIITHWGYIIERTSIDERLTKLDVVDFLSRLPDPEQIEAEILQNF